MQVFRLVILEGEGVHRCKPVYVSNWDITTITEVRVRTSTTVCLSGALVRDCPFILSVASGDPSHGAHGHQEKMPIRNTTRHAHLHTAPRKFL